MNSLIHTGNDDFQVLTSNTLVFTNENILLKYYYACKNLSLHKSFESLHLSFPLKVHTLKAKDKNGTLQVIPSKNITPGTIIKILFRKPVLPQQKYSFKLSVLFDFGQEITRWQDTFFLDWGKQNIDEIIYLKTNPLFVSALGEWKQDQKNYRLTPLKGWKRIVSHARKENTLRFEWGAVPTFILQESFSLESPIPLQDVQVKFFLPKTTQLQRFTWLNRNELPYTREFDPSKNILVSLAMHQQDPHQWVYTANYKITQFPRIMHLANLGKIEPVIKAGKKYPHLIKETELLTIHDSNIQTLANAVWKSAKNMHELLTLIFEFIHQKIVYQENGERYSAAYTLKTRRGDCSEFADLFITLLRAIGIPAFGVLGYVIDVKKRSIAYHEWLKVLTEQGWLSFDPTWGYFGSVGVTHIEVAHEIHEHNTWYSGFQAVGDTSKAIFTTKIKLLPPF